ncbi:thiamine diphosphokinase [Ovoidimarina sediminis]|uniref:thiamine diphosphokinase n=1 Tax=Ovoidimarina sediminis TaxID=3079856 RepID=UPI002912C5DB|nr:thiamine diphosphokinase [Rhodophyticola sp. MJ-SS7]MDU8942718.1 thiamine diphosphokinase [Rhodophyticola sp. MJ-SS7]
MAFHSDFPVTLLGAGPVYPGDIKEILNIAPGLVAADGGAATALEAGRVPDLVIGDFDSLPHSTGESLPKDRLLHVTEQDSTDFEKCLSRITAPLILALGFTGARIDHELAVYSALARHVTARCIVIGSDDIVFRVPRRLSLGLAPGDRVSLFPMGPVRGRSEGLRWPIDGIDFAPGGRIGTSNAATGPVQLEFEGDAMLAIIPRAELAAAMAGLSAAPRGVRAR